MRHAHVIAMAALLAACSDEGPRGARSAAPAASASPSGSHRRREREAPSSATPVASASAPPPPSGPHRPPNILFLLSDDQRADSLSCMPKLKQELGAKGVTFSHYFASTPLCCPARTTLMTGLYAHNHHVRTNGDADDEEGEEVQGDPGAVQFNKEGNEQKVIAKYLQSAGYLTGHFGKYLNGYDKILKTDARYVPPYWNEWHAFPHAEYYDFILVEQGKAFPKTKRTCFLSDAAGGRKKEKKCKDDVDEVVDDGKEHYSSDVLASRVVDFVKDAHDAGKPFFAYVALKAPHGPFQSPRRYQPDPKKVEFTDEAMRRLGACELFERKDPPPSVLEADVSDKPKWIQELEGKTKPSKIDAIRKQQLVSLLGNEDALESILDALDAAGERDNTILVYAGDNGFSWGEHHYTSKNCAYEECERVPLVIYDPRRPQSGSRTSDALVADVDIAPTLLDLAGVTWPTGNKVNGVSLGAILRDPSATFPRDEILVECWGNQKPAHPPIVAGVRTRSWKYVVQYADGDLTKPSVGSAKAPTIELYDLQKDPYELDNLLAIPSEARTAKGYTQAGIDGVVTEMKGRLEQLLKQ
ncbi:MAG: sulfatase [Polyangiaceae bacterium]